MLLIACRISGCVTAALVVFFFNDTATTEIYTLSLHDALPISVARDSINLAIVWGPKAGYWVKRAAVPLSMVPLPDSDAVSGVPFAFDMAMGVRHRDRELKARSEEHTSELQSRLHLVCRLLLEKKKKKKKKTA